MLAGIIARPAAISARTNSGVTKSGIAAPQDRPSRVAADAARPQFSRIATNSISRVMMPARAYASCVTALPLTALSGAWASGKGGVAASDDGGSGIRPTEDSVSLRAAIHDVRNRGAPRVISMSVAASVYGPEES